MDHNTWPITGIGRGNSGIPNDLGDPDFDESYGGLTSLKYLRGLPFVNPASVGMMGHSLGAEMAYAVALADPAVKALVISHPGISQQPCHHRGP